METGSEQQVANNIRERANIMRSRNLSLNGIRILINSTLLSKGWHVGTVMDMPDETYSHIMNTVFDHLCRGWKVQCISKEVLSLPKERGGLGIKDPDIQTYALQIHHLARLLNPEEKGKWTVLARYYIADIIGKLGIQQWEFIATPDRKAYTGTDVPPVYKTFTNFLTKHHAAFLALTEVSTKGIYDILSKAKNKYVTVAGVDYWGNTLRFINPLNWKVIWENVFNSLCVNRRMNTLYFLFHNALPTGQRMDNERGAYPKVCPRCSVYEDAYHTFITCPSAKNVWDAYFFVYETVLRRSRISIGETVFLQNLPPDEHQKRLLVTLTSLIVNEIWMSRNAHQKEGEEPNVRRSTTTINAILRELHTVSHRHEENFSIRFCMPNPMCTEERGILYFNLPDDDAEEDEEAMFLPEFTK